MPTIRITDSLGFVVEADAAPGSSIARYFRNIVSLSLQDPALALDSLTLKSFPLASVRTGLKVEQGIDIGNGDTELMLSAGLTAGFTIFKKKGDAVVPVVFGEQAAVAVREDEAWVSFDITPSIAAGLTAERADLTFGFEAGTETSLAIFRPFALANGEPKLGAALLDTIKVFSLPGDIEDLRNMTVDTIATVEGLATLRFDAGLDVALQPNALASIDAPGLPGSIDVNFGASVGVQSSYTISSGFELRLRKLDRHRVELGYYKRSGHEFKVGVTASAGISVEAGGTDLTSQLMKAISGDPEVNEDDLKAAGLDDGKIQAIKDAVEAGVDRSLELSLAAEFRALAQGSAAFLYVVDLQKLGEQGTAAVRLALDGDLSGLIAPESQLPAGVEVHKSIFKTLREKRTSVRINLLGIFNFISVTKLLAEGEVLYNHETGDVVITDKVSAERVRATLHNFAADPEKLRRVLLENFLFTAAYRGSKLAVASPDLKSVHSYFELHARTNRQTMKDNLDVAEALSLLHLDDKNKLLGNTTDFGSSTLYTETRYEDKLLADAFLDASGDARPMDFYEKAGREALKLLYQANDTDKYRRLPALDDELWKKMRAAGSSPNVMALFDALNDVQKAVVDSDYRVIVWWAKAMHTLAKEVVRVHKFFAGHPNPEPGDNSLRKLRKNFNEAVTGVAKTTKKHFGEPWGLIAMDIAANHQAYAEVLVTGDVVSYEAKRGAAKQTRA